MASKERPQKDFSNKAVLVMLVLVVVVSIVSMLLYLNALQNLQPAQPVVEEQQATGVVSLRIIEPPQEQQTEGGESILEGGE